MITHGYTWINMVQIWWIIMLNHQQKPFLSSPSEACMHDLPSLVVPAHQLIWNLFTIQGVVGCLLPNGGLFLSVSHWLIPRVPWKPDDVETRDTRDTGIPIFWGIFGGFFGDFGGLFMMIISIIYLVDHDTGIPLLVDDYSWWSSQFSWRVFDRNHQPAKV